MKKLLTDKFVAGIRCENRENFFDAKTRGLVMRVSSKRRVWYFVYRRGGPTEWVKLGEYPSLSLADARTHALDHRHAIDVDGKDPAVERRQPPPKPAPKAFSFADFVPTFIAFQRGKKKTWNADQQMIDRYLVDAWGALPLKAITRQHVHEVLDTVVGKGLTIGANRLQALISRVFTVALDRGLIDAHPSARLIKRFAEQPRTRVLSDTELRELWRGLDAQPGAASDAVRLRLLLGQRGAETAGMQWSEVDLEAARWSLPATRTKNRRPHVVPLPPTALTVLTRRRAGVPPDEPRVFPALRLASHEHSALSGIHGGAYTWKDLRRTVASRLAALGFDETTIGRVLNHARVSVTSKHYNQHLYLDEIGRALEAWDRELDAIVKNTRPPQKVLRHRPRGRA